MTEPAGSGVVTRAESPRRGGALNVGCLFNSAREGEMEILSDGFPEGSSPVNDGHNESGAKEQPESKIAAPRTAPVDLRKFTLPDRRTRIVT